MLNQKKHTYKNFIAFAILCALCGYMFLLRAADTHTVERAVNKEYRY